MEKKNIIFYCNVVTVWFVLTWLSLVSIVLITTFLDRFSISGLVSIMDSADKGLVLSYLWRKSFTNVQKKFRSILYTDVFLYSKSACFCQHYLLMLFSNINAMWSLWVCYGFAVYCTSQIKRGKIGQWIGNPVDEKNQNVFELYHVSPCKKHVKVLATL